jgi:hypothetical protein
VRIAVDLGTTAADDRRFISRTSSLAQGFGVCEARAGRRTDRELPWCEP